MANFYLGEGGIVNYDGDHIQASLGQVDKADDDCCRKLWTCTRTHGTGQPWTNGPSEPSNFKGLDYPSFRYVSILKLSGWRWQTI